ncbi:hypothetical protein M2139_000106 [Enterococcus sp. PF1-24]|uniref:McrB family protein n=1 Tax=unclassified Enterococcus TaxID=2608891 RepID=UPI0024747082|nr:MULTISPECIES: AAA family ATPase [unclassified Enterococcus]MDH6363131.1 hypothetical protein [Enterococcus sp. PFB1-1]MDH6400225.1 hypothetical protein [Enterococcus sp. PF1-24]
MEYIDRIFYRKINPSDFKKLYDIDKPEGGGGQTYLEAAGISNDKIVDFLSCAEVANSPLSDEARSVYTFNAYVLGDLKNQCAFVEFAPRKGRNNYRISRQNMKYKHPAWSLGNGFPEPSKGDDGEYTSYGDFAGIIDNLVILIIRTTYRRYYAGFINAIEMPENWPHNIGLEDIFSGERRDVINMDAYKLQFINDAINPFGEYVPAIEESNRATTGCNVLLYGVPGSGKSWTIEHEYCDNEECMERLVFHPDYMYSDFVGQILPVVKDDDKVRYEFMPGPFTKLLKRAYSNPEKSYYLIVEEINRGNAPAIFGEIFQLLDRKDEDEFDETGNLLYKRGTSEYGITNAHVARIVYGDEEHKVRIPANMSILGTMNTSDQNVFTLDTAFQRRWIMRMIPNSFANHKFADKLILDTDVSWKQFCEAINEEILRRNNITSSEDKRLGAYFISASDLEMQPVNDGMGEKERIQIEHNNNRFAEKVLKYLWDDAFKFSHQDTFNTRQFSSLEKVIAGFMDSKKTKNERFRVFNENLRKMILEGVTTESNEVLDDESENTQEL